VALINLCWPAGWVNATRFDGTGNEPSGARAVTGASDRGGAGLIATGWPACGGNGAHADNASDRANAVTPPCIRRMRLGAHINERLDMAIFR
jgi:hypothetical protein